jgi:hypothetical protein
MCCILYYHSIYGVLSHYVDMILTGYGVMYWQSCVFCSCFIILYIYLVYLDYFYICGDCSPVRFLEVNKNSIQFNSIMWATETDFNQRTSQIEIDSSKIKLNEMPPFYYLWPHILQYFPQCRSIICTLLNTTYEESYVPIEHHDRAIISNKLHLVHCCTLWKAGRLFYLVTLMLPLL